jgi:methionyl-tRNA synthetase
MPWDDDAREKLRSLEIEKLRKTKTLLIITLCPLRYAFYISKEDIMDNITFDYFTKMDLRVAEIKACEDVEGADKLYKLTINIGEERTIVAGIKLHYTKEELVGKKIAVVTNLEPRTLRGIESHGMLLAASSEDKSAIVLLTLDKDIAPGAKIS